MELDALRALIATVDAGSVLGASDALAVSRSTLRSRLDRLSAAVDDPLFIRDPSGLRPTPLVQRLLPRARQLVRDADDLSRLAHDRLGVDSRPVTVAMPADLSHDIVAPAILLLRQRLPNIRLQLIRTHEPRLMVEQDVDVVLAPGELPADVAYRSVVLHRLSASLWAHPAYLDRHGRPTRPEDLLDHTLLSWAPPGRPFRQWIRRDHTAPLLVRPLIESHDNQVIQALVGRQVGIGQLLRDHFSDPARDAGLEPVLPDQMGTSHPVWLLVADHMAQREDVRQLLAELQAFVDATASART